MPWAGAIRRPLPFSLLNPASTDSQAWTNLSLSALQDIAYLQGKTALRETSLETSSRGGLNTRMKRLDPLCCEGVQGQRPLERVDRRRQSPLAAGNSGRFWDAGRDHIDKET
jgi:hypothetical protein